MKHSHPLLRLGSAVLLTGGLLTQAWGNGGGVPVYPPNAKPFGKSLTEWSVEYVRWFNAIPAPSPLFHLDADTCVNQSGPVWFLADVGANSGDELDDFTLTRHCTVPAGKAIYVPVLTLLGLLCPEWGVDEEQFITGFQDWRAGAQDIHAEVDGVVIANLPDYEFLTPLFDITLSPDSEWLTPPWRLDCPVLRNAVIGQAIMLPPLSVGEHTVRFGWTFVDEACDGVCAVADITYRLNVVPRR